MSTNYNLLIYYLSNALFPHSNYSVGLSKVVEKRHGNAVFKRKSHPPYDFIFFLCCTTVWSVLMNKQHPGEMTLENIAGM